jgi:hypothetical protein
MTRKGDLTMASRNNDVVTIPISVRNTNDFNNGTDKKGIKAGTFEGPDPLVSITPGTKVEWQITPANFDFTLTFQGPSPFSGVTTIPKATGGKSNTYVAAGLGHYHYSVSVTDDRGNTYVISGCPELDVGTTS